jgi:hypothetical protein
MNHILWKATWHILIRKPGKYLCYVVTRLVIIVNRYQCSRDYANVNQASDNFGKSAHAIRYPISGGYGSAFYLPPLPPLQKSANTGGYGSEYGNNRGYSAGNQIDGNLTDEGADARISHSTVCISNIYMFPSIEYIFFSYLGWVRRSSFANQSSRAYWAPAKEVGCEK